MKTRFLAAAILAACHVPAPTGCARREDRGGPQRMMDTLRAVDADQRALGHAAPPPEGHGR